MKKKEKVNEQVDRFILHSTLHENLCTKNVKELGGFGSDEAAVNALIGDLQLSRDTDKGNALFMNSRVHLASFSTSLSDVHEVSTTDGPMSEMFLKRALVKSSGGAMLALNDGYHLRSYLNSNGNIQLTPRVKVRKTLGEDSTAGATPVSTQGGMPLLPAEAEKDFDGAATQPMALVAGKSVTSEVGIVADLPLSEKV